jgi:aminoglycoside phosphotransferase (APT) family kinase protein
MVNGGQRGRLAELATKLAGMEPRNRPGNLAVLHGDLHLKNMIALESDAIALIDLDNLCLGDPLIDLEASLPTSTIGTTGAGKRAAARPELLVKQLLAGYFEAAGEPFNEQSLRWQIAAALIGERAVRCITRLKPGGRPLVDWLIDLAAQTVEGL